MTTSSVCRVYTRARACVNSMTAEKLENSICRACELAMSEIELRRGKQQQGARQKSSTLDFPALFRQAGCLRSTYLRKRNAQARFIEIPLKWWLVRVCARPFVIQLRAARAPLARQFSKVALAKATWARACACTSRPRCLPIHLRFRVAHRNARVKQKAT